MSDNELEHHLRTINLCRLCNLSIPRDLNLLFLNDAIIFLDNIYPLLKTKTVFSESVVPWDIYLLNDTVVFGVSCDEIIVSFIHIIDNISNILTIKQAEQLCFKTFTEYFFIKESKRLFSNDDSFLLYLRNNQTINIFCK